MSSLNGLIKIFSRQMAEIAPIKVSSFTSDYPTIGYGHVVKDDEDFSAGIDESQAEELLRQDAQIAERAVLRLINVPLTDGQFDALVSFTYYTAIIPNARTETLLPIIQEKVTPDSIVYTDAFR